MRRAARDTAATSTTKKDAYIYLIKTDGEVTRDNNGKPTGPGSWVKKIDEATFYTTKSSTRNIDLELNGPGLYCITLDGRRDLRRYNKGLTATSGVFFSEGCFYFRITS